MAYLRRSRTCNWYVYWVRDDAGEQARTSEDLDVARNQARLCIQGPFDASRSLDDQELFCFSEIRRMLVENDFTSIPGCSGAERHRLVPALREFVVDVQKEYSLGGIERERSALYCCHCGQRLSLEEILGLARMSPDGWLHFRCPECKTQSFLNFSEIGIAIGHFDGFPGPSFIPISSVSIENLRVAGYPGGLRVTIGEQEWLFKKEP